MGYRSKSKTYINLPPNHGCFLHQCILDSVEEQYNTKQYGPKNCIFLLFLEFIQNYLMNMMDLTILNHQV